MVFGIVCAVLIVFVPPRFRAFFYKRVMKAVFRILMRAFSAIITYHQKCATVAVTGTPSLFTSESGVRSV